MQTQAITTSNVNFQSKNDLQNASAFVNMSDAQLHSLAYNSVDKKQDKKDRRAIAATFIAMPVVDSIAKGVLLPQNFLVKTKEGSNLVKTQLSHRLLSSGKTAALWGAVLAGASVYFAAKNKIVKGSPTLQQFHKDHPIASFFGDIGLMIIGGTLGLLGINKLYEKLKEKYPKLKEELKTKKTKILEGIDNTNFNQKTLPKIEAWFAKVGKEHPYITGTGKLALANSVWVLLGVAFIQMLKHSKNKNDKIEQNYQILKSAQLQTAKNLASNLSVQRDVLAQNQKGLAVDLEKVMGGEKQVSLKEIREMKKAAKIYENEKLQARQNEQLKQDKESDVIREIEIVTITERPNKKSDK